jgi:hypothetical protein
VVKVFNSLNETRGTSNLIVLIGAIFPFVVDLPIKSLGMMDQMNKATTAMAYELLQDSENVKGGSQSIKDRSILGLLSKFQLCVLPLVIDVCTSVNGKPEDATFKFVLKEVVAQVRILSYWSIVNQLIGYLDCM